jgi:hypothetical protein
MGAQRPKPIHVFISYARADETLKDELLKHLASLRRSGAIAIWHDRDLAPGEPLSRIEAEIDRADIVLLLLSADYLASDDLHDREMMRAIRRHEGGEAKVVAVLLRPITIEQDAPFADLESFPSGRKAVASWPSRDEAWSDVVRGLRRALGLPAGEDADPDSARSDDASAARVEIARSRDRMIIVVTAIVAVTVIFVRTSGAPTPYITAVIGLACVGAAGSVLRHARRSKKLAVLGAAAVAGAAVMGTSAGASAGAGNTGAAGVGSLISALVNATAVGIAAAAAGVGIGLGVEGSVAAVDKHVMPPSVAPRLNPPFDGISSLLAADAGAADEDAGGADEDAGASDEDAGADDDAGALDEDAGTTAVDAGLDASTKVHPDQAGSVDQATFNKNAANAVAAAEKEATACLRPGVACGGQVAFTPDGYVGSQSITCASADGKVDAAVTRCVLPIFKKRRIPPLHKPTTSAGATVKVAFPR